MTGRGPRPDPAPLIGLLLPALLIGAASAQVPRLEPLPWHALGDTLPAAVMFAAGRLEEPRLDWSVDRAELTVLWHGGEGTWLFLREELLSFATGGHRVLDRWPDLAGPDAGPDWPDERQVSGWGRPEFGVLTVAGLPLLGRCDVGLALGLPVGSDAFYPFSAASFPARLLVRRPFRLAGPLGLLLRAGGLLQLDSGRDDLDAAAFPGGWLLGAALTRDGGRGGELALEADLLDGRRAVRARLDWWLRTGERHALRLRAQQALDERADRPFGFGASVAWQVGLPPAPAAGPR